NEPTLLHLIEVRHRRIRVTCRTCPVVRYEKPGVVRQFERDRDPERFRVDWEKGEAEGVCLRCSTRENVKTRDQNAQRRGGYKALSHSADGLLTWMANHPEEHTKAARQGRRKEPHQPTERDTLLKRLGLLTVDPKGRFSLCRICHRLIFTAENAVARKQADGK